MGKSSQSIIYDGVEYFPRFTANFRSLADILYRSKGLNRSMGQFARDCGISPATFSRIVQGRYEKALSLDMLEKIVNHADPHAMITMKEALYANGYIPAEDLTPKDISAINYDRKNTSSEDDYPNKVEDIFEVITKELFCRDLSFTTFPGGIDKEPNLNSKLGLDAKNKSRWIVTFHIQGYEPHYFKYIGNLINDEIYSKESLWRALEPYCTFFLRDFWEPETTIDTLYSFVFKIRSAYDIFVETMKEVQVNNYFSAVLLDMKLHRVVEEFMVPRKDGDVLKSIFS